MSDRRLGIIIYGKCRQLNDLWRKWLDEAKNLIIITGFVPTHIGISSISMKDGKIKTLSRSEKKIKKIISSGEDIKHMSIYSLKKGFHTALDSDVWVVLNKNYVYCEIPFEKYEEFLIKKIQEILLGFIELEGGEVFLMDKEQVPFNYVINRGMEKYSTLEILSIIN